MDKTFLVSDNVLNELIVAIRQGKEVDGHDITSIKSDMILLYGKDVEELSDEVIESSLRHYLFSSQTGESNDGKFDLREESDVLTAVKKDDAEDISRDFNKLAIEAANSNSFYFEDLNTSYHGPTSTFSDQTRSNRFFSDASSSSVPRSDPLVNNEFSQTNSPPPGLIQHYSQLSQGSNDRPLGSELQQYSTIHSPYTITPPQRPTGPSAYQNSNPVNAFPQGNGDYLQGSGGGGSGLMNANQNENSEKEFLSLFWEISFKLFYNICSSTCITRDCLYIVGELLSLIERWTPMFQSPAILIATDVVIQRAMYELSDKFVKKIDLQGFDIQNHFDSQQNIEDCISLLSTTAIPLCVRLQNNYQWNLSYLDLSNSTFTKMHTLNRQLQELLAWTSLSGQAAIPDSFVEMLRFITVHHDTGNGTNGGNMKMTTPRSMATLEMFDNLLVTNINEGGGNNNNLIPDFIASVENRMIHFLKKGAAGSNLPMNQNPYSNPSTNVPCFDDTNVKRCGCNVIGMSFYEGIDLDYVALCLLPQSPRRSPSTEANEEAILKELESVVEVELLYEGALKHLRACIKDCSVATNEFISNLMKPPSMMNDSNNNVQIMDPSYVPRPSIHILQSLSNGIVLDAEEIHNAGEQFINSCSTIKSDRILNRFPILSALLNKIEAYHEEIDREEKGRISNLRRIVKNYEKLFRENGFNNVRSITNRCRFVQLKFIVYDNRYHRQNIGFTINLDSLLPIQGTELLRNIIKSDTTGKIRIYLNTIKKFIKSHKIHDSSNGYLSLFGWMIMALHVLIKFKYLFYIHGKSYCLPPSSSNNNSTNDGGDISLGGGFPGMTSQDVELRNVCVNQLHRTSIMELLDRFFRYYVEEFDTFRHVVSIRNVNDVITKASWKKNPVLWRLSVEDPCDPLGTKNAYDFGGTISRPGQLTTYKALRRAVYGMRSILIMGVEAAKTNIKKLFSKTELIHLARKSEYMGATIPQPKPWQPSKNPTTIISPRDILKPLSNEMIQKIESLDLSNFATRPLANSTSYHDLTSENINYGFLSSRSELASGAFPPDITPRYRSDSSAHGFSRVISEGSLSGMLNSPRDVLNMSNHSVTSSVLMGGGEMRSPIYNDPNAPFGSGFPHNQYGTPGSDYSMMRSNLNSNNPSTTAKSKVPLIPKLALHNLNKETNNTSLSAMTTPSNQESSWPNTATSTQPSTQRNSARPVVPSLSLQNIEKFKQDQGGSDNSNWQQSRSSGWFNPENPTAPVDNLNPQAASRTTPRDMVSPLNTARTVDSETSEKEDPTSVTRHPSQGSLFNNDSSNTEFPSGIGAIGSEIAGGSSDFQNPVNRIDSFNISWTGSSQFGGGNNFNAYEELNRGPNMNSNFGRPGGHSNNNFNHYQSGGGSGNYHNNPNVNYSSSNNNYQLDSFPYETQLRDYRPRGGGGGGGYSGRTYTPRGHQTEYYGLNSARSDLGDSNHSFHSQSSPYYGGGGGPYGERNNFTPRQQQFQQQHGYNQPSNSYSNYSNLTSGQPPSNNMNNNNTNFNQTPNNHYNLMNGNQFQQQQPPSSSSSSNYHSNPFHNNHNNNNNNNNNTTQSQPYQSWKQF